jgi:hypothetical protein
MLPSTCISKTSSPFKAEQQQQQQQQENKNMKMKDEAEQEQEGRVLSTDLNPNAAEE